MNCSQFIKNNTEKSEWTHIRQISIRGQVNKWGYEHFHIELFKKKKVEKIQLLNLAVKSCAIIKCHFFRNWKRKSPFACFLGKIMSCFIRQCDGPLSHFAQLCSKLKITKLAPRSNRLNLLLISLSHLFARSQANLLPKRCNGTFLGVVNAIPSIFTASTLCGYLVSQTHSWPLSSRSLPKT